MRRAMHGSMQGKLTHIEMLRGLAALAVTWFHLTNQYQGLARATGNLGWLGVDAFFVISGFVIPYSLWASDYGVRKFPRFMLRRLVRLEPPYLISIVLVVVLAYASQLAPGFAGQPAHFTAPQLAAHLFYLVPAFHMDWINVVYWSLTFEFVFYICAGLLSPWLYRRSILWTAALTLAAAFAVPAKTGLLEPRVLLFLLGIASMRYFTGRDGRAMFLATLAGTGAAIWAVGAPANAIVGVATALVLAMIKVPEFRLFTGLGAISYSLYLTHVPIGGRVVNLGRRFVHGTAAELALSLTALVISLVFAYVFYRLFEVPATALARKLSVRARGEPAAKPALQPSGG